MQNLNEFKIKYGGELNLIDVHTFTSSLINTASVAEEINASLNSNMIIEMKLKTLEPGSFIAGIQIKEIERPQSSVFEKTENNVAQKIIRQLVYLNEYKKHIGSGTALIVEDIDGQVTIENKRGDKKIFDKSIHDLYSTNDVIAASISNNYSVLEGDSSVSSFELLDHNNIPIFIAERESFDELAVKTVVETKEKKSKVETAELRIHKLVFDPKYKWDFWYKSIKISANIIDESFFEGIDQDEKFGKGDVLIVELQTNLVFDKSVDIFVTDSYQVNRVIEHTPKGEVKQLKLTDFEQH